MNHGGVARVTRTGIHISPDLIRPIFIDDGASVFAFFLPPPDETRCYPPLGEKGDAHDKAIDRYYEQPVRPSKRSATRGPQPDGQEMEPFEDDIVLTAIPPDQWPYVAKVKVHMAHRDGALAALTEGLHDLGINILLAEATRQNRMFAVLTVVLSFERLEFNKLREQLLASLDRRARIDETGKTAVESLIDKMAASWLRVGEPRDLKSPATQRRSGKSEPERGAQVTELRDELKQHYRSFECVIRLLIGCRAPTTAEPQLAEQQRYDHDRLWKDHVANLPPALLDGWFRLRFPQANGGESVLFYDVWADSKADAEPNEANPPAWPYPDRVVSASKLSTLKYLHWRMVERSFTRQDDALKHRSFRFEAVGRGHLEPKESAGLFLRSKDIHKLLPATAVAELDTREMICRISLIPADKLRGFFEVKVRYTCQETSSGLLAAITAQLKDRVSIWRTVNHTQRFRFPEHGYLKFLLRAKDGCCTERCLIQDVHHAVEHMDKPVPAIDEVHVRRLCPFRIFISIRHEHNFPRRREFLDAIQREANRLGIHPDGLIIVDDPTGIAQLKVIDQLRQADGFLQLVYGVDVAGDPAGGAWLDAEALAARALDLPTRFVGAPQPATDGGPYGSTTHRKVWGAELFTPLPENASAPDVRKTLRSALVALVQEIERSLHRGGARWRDERDGP